jgi:hypothetical protein
MTIEIAKLKMALTTISRCSTKTIALVILSAMTSTLLAAQQPPPAGCKFAVLSARVMSEQEVKERVPQDVIGSDIAVRLRLSCAETGITVLTEKEFIWPVGYAVTISDGKVTWLSAGRRNSSPGIEPITKLVPCSWVALLGYSALEWELGDSTLSKGEKHAFTVFIKQGKNGEPKEIISDSFVVPGRPMPAQ